MDWRQLPAVDQLVSELGDWPLPRALKLEVARTVIAQIRQEEIDGDPQQLVESRLAELSLNRLRRVINASGVLLHTNLGRAPWAPAAREAADLVASGYSNLEFDVATGKRGRRGGYVLDPLAGLTGAEAALVVNNNASALVLAVAALANGREVIVSRGELVEIGGSYRLPEIIVTGGAQLREVGTTNRTRVADYRTAITEATGAILKVHASNFRIVGFVEEASLSALRPLGVPLIFDAGSGLLDSQVPWWSGSPPSWIGDEPGVRQSVAAGADLVLFSGDKLFGGPQAGIVVGQKAMIDRMRSHPLARAFRIDGPRLAAVGATIDLYADGRGGEVPIWRMAGVGYGELEHRLNEVLDQAGVDGELVESTSVLGAGSIPGAGIPTPALSIAAESDQVFFALLRQPVPVLARRQDGRLLVDLRAVDAEDDSQVAEALASACR